MKQDERARHSIWIRRVYWAIPFRLSTNDSLPWGEWHYGRPLSRISKAQSSWRAWPNDSKAWQLSACVTRIDRHDIDDHPSLVVRKLSQSRRRVWRTSEVFNQGKILTNGGNQEVRKLGANVVKWNMDSFLACGENWGWASLVCFAFPSFNWFWNSDEWRWPHSPLSISKTSVRHWRSHEHFNATCSTKTILVYCPCPICILVSLVSVLPAKTRSSWRLLEIRLTLESYSSRNCWIAGPTNQRVVTSHLETLMHAISALKKPLTTPFKFRPTDSRKQRSLWLYMIPLSFLRSVSKSETSEHRKQSRNLCAFAYVAAAAWRGENE